MLQSLLLWLIGRQLQKDQNRHAHLLNAGGERSSTLTLSRGICSETFVGVRLSYVLYLLVKET